MRFAPLCLLTAACSYTQLYTGAELPKGEVARLDVSGTGDGAIGDVGDEAFEAWLVGIDGVILVEKHNRVAVLPGKHTLDVRWQRLEVADWNAYYGEKGYFEVVDAGLAILEVDAPADSHFHLIWPPGNDPPMRLRRSGPTNAGPR